MEFVVEKKSKPKFFQKISEKFILLSDKLGNLTKDDIIDIITKITNFISERYIYHKPIKKPKVEETKEISNLFVQYIESEKQFRRSKGASILISIIGIISIICLFIISSFIDFLFSIMEWWVVVMTIMLIAVPIVGIVAFLIATND